MAEDKGHTPDRPAPDDEVVEIDPGIVEIVEIDPMTIEVVEISDPVPPETPAPAAPGDVVLPSEPAHAPAPVSAPASKDAAEPPEPVGLGREDRPDPSEFKELPADLEYELPEIVISPDAPAKGVPDAPQPPAASPPPVTPIVLEDPLDAPGPGLEPAPDAAPAPLETGVEPPLAADGMAEVEMGEYGGLVDEGPPPEKTMPAPEPPLAPQLSGEEMDGEPQADLPELPPLSTDDMAAMEMSEYGGLIDDGPPPEEPTPEPEPEPPLAPQLSEEGMGGEPQADLPELPPLSADDMAEMEMSEYGSYILDEELPEEEAYPSVPLPDQEAQAPTGLADAVQIFPSSPQPPDSATNAPSDAAVSPVDEPPAEEVMPTPVPEPDFIAPEAGEEDMQAQALAAEEEDLEAQATPEQDGPDDGQDGGPGADDDEKAPDQAPEAPGQNVADEASALTGLAAAHLDDDDDPYASDAFDEDEDGLDDLSDEPEEPEEEEPEEDVSDSSWTIHDPEKFPDFVLHFAHEEEMLLFSGETCKRLQNIGEHNKFLHYFVDFYESNSLGVTDVSGEAKYAEVMLRKSLEEQGEMGRDDDVAIYFKKKKSKSLMSMLYQIYPKKRYEALMRAYQHYPDGFLVHDSLGMLYGLLQSLDSKITHALAMPTGEGIMFIVGQGEEVYAARRIVMMGTDTAAVTEGVFALIRDAEALESQIPGELEHIDWIIPYTENLEWEPHPAWKIPIKLWPLTRFQQADKYVYSALPDLAGKLRAKTSIGPKEEKVFRPMERAERWLWVALGLLCLGLAASYWHYGGLSREATKFNQDLLRQIKQVQQRMPTLPHYKAKDLKPVLDMAENINTATIAPTMSDLWNEISHTKPKACRIDNMSFGYKPDGISISISGEVELGLAHAQRVFAEFIDNLQTQGFTVNNRSINLDIQGNGFNITVYRPIGQR